MGEAAGQVTERLHLLGLPKLLLDRVPLGHIARNLGEALQRTGVVADGFDHHMGPELAAILALAPTFALVFSGPRGDRQTSLGNTGAPVRLEIETREVLPDDLGRGISLDPLRARVPVRDLTLGIEHEDGVIGDTDRKST